MANFKFCVDSPAHQVVGQVTREDICCKWSCAAVASVNQRGQLPGSKKRQKIRFWPKLSPHTHQFVEVVHDWVWKGFCRFCKAHWVYSIAIRAYIANTKTNTQSYICNVEFAEVPHAIESHMNLCNCAEESAVKICQGRRVEGAKIWEKSLCRPARKTCNKLNSLMRSHYNHTAFISISVLQSVTCY